MCFSSTMVVHHHSRSAGHPAPCYSCISRVLFLLPVSDIHHMCIFLSFRSLVIIDLYSLLPVSPTYHMHALVSFTQSSSTKKLADCPLDILIFFGVFYQTICVQNSCLLRVDLFVGF